MRAVISSCSFRSSINRSAVLLRTACGSTQSLGSDGGSSANVVAFKRAFSTALRARSSTCCVCCDAFFSSDIFLEYGNTSQHIQQGGRARGATGWVRVEVDGKLSAHGSLKGSTCPEEKAGASVPPGTRVVLALVSNACRSFLSRKRNCSMCLAYCRT